MVIRLQYEGHSRKIPARRTQQEGNGERKRYKDIRDVDLDFVSAMEWMPDTEG